MPTVRRQKPKSAAPRDGEETARLRTLRDYAILDTPPEAAFERIARLAARFLSVPIALVSFVDEHRQWFKATCGLGLRGTSRGVSFCNHALSSDDVLVVPDAALDERFADNPLVTGKPFVRFYAGAPLRAPDGHRLGTLCVIDYRPRRPGPAELETLRELAMTVVDELELRRAAAALRAEITQRERAERDLAEALRSVESQVQARTAELSARNEQLRIAKEEAELANSAKGNFLSRMSHELRTPLNAILGFGQILQMDVETERQQECVGHVLSGGQQLLTMVDTVLDISRLEPGRNPPTLEAIPVREAILTGIDLVRPLTAPRGVTIALEDSPAADRAVFVDRRRLGQVLFHLLSNAVKYNRPGGEVTVSCRDQRAARLRIAVRDTGPGIAPEDLGRLFTPFDRLGAERGDVAGTGLGLALCKNLVEAQGGQIGVESLVGEGSTVWIQLPLAPPAGPPRRPPRQGARTVLYVEDNLSNLRLIERLLQRRPGIRLLTATLGRDGLELTRQRRPDLVLLDAHLPDLSGLEVLTALQADPDTRPIPVVVISADALPASIEAMCAAGARRYITKPLDIHQLVEMLAELA